MKTKPTVFISHASEDEHLGRAWMELIQSIPGKAEVPYLAEDMRRGIGSGEKWAENIDQALSDAEVTIAILTPSSNNRPWILWESGVAYGRDKVFVPISCYLDKDKINPIFQRFQARNVTTKEAAGELCKELFFPNEQLSDFQQTVFDAALQQYEDMVSKHKVIAQTHGLFNDHFHNHDRAKKLDGYWLADWDFYDEKGKLKAYERDELCIWTTDDRLRAVGYNTKTGIDRLGEIAKFYPIEGVVSSSGWIALSFWSAAEIQYCGAILLQDDGTGLCFKGTWEGYSTQEFGIEASLKKGKVTLKKILKADINPALDFMNQENRSVTCAELASAISKNEEITLRILNHLTIINKVQKRGESEWVIGSD